MKKILALSLTDCRSIFRERILYFIFVAAPILMFLLCRFVAPLLALRFPILVDYYPVLLLLMIVQICLGIGFVIASIILDERDEGVLTAIRVMPLPSNTFIVYRLLFSMSIGFLTALVMVRWTGLVTISWPASLGVAFLFSLVAPLVMLALPSFSENKVEGLAFFKIFNLILLLPAATFFITSKITYLLAVIPLYWTYQFLVEALEGGNILMTFSTGILVHVVWIWGLLHLFKKRVFYR